MRKKVAVIHTSFVSVNDLTELFKEYIPFVQLHNIVDDSLLAEVIESGGLTSSVVRRICAYAQEAEAMGADLILNQCSSVGEAVDVARKMLNVNFLKIDEPMAEEAANIGGNISVIATVPTTLGPSCRLIERTALSLNKHIRIKQCLVEGAFDALVKEGNREKHNDMVLKTVEQEACSADTIVLAQGSMICLLPKLGHIKVPVLTSPRSGVIRTQRYLGI